MRLRRSTICKSSRKHALTSRLRAKHLIASATFNQLTPGPQEHVCDRHVGRKSTNNLNLTCQWGACRTTTVKRDHITSHIRVHVPLKPHKCDFCGKAFKRPQDLKKHVKTHADDSVLSNSPSQGPNGRGAIGNGNIDNGMGPQHKSEYNSTYQHLASALADHIGSSATSNYYNTDGHLGNPYANYQAGMGANGANGAGYAQHNGNGQYSGYGSVSYPNSTAVADLQSLDTRRRAIEALNDFLGDIKRRAINPGNYYDVGQRLGSSNALPLPVGTGYNTGYNNTAGNYNSLNAASLLESFNQGHDVGGGAGTMQSGVAAQTYSLPMPNARTKGDLQEIDRFLEQLQHTVYEASSSAASAGVQQPGVHAQFTGDYGFGSQTQFRTSNSPPNFQNHSNGGASFGQMTAATMPGMTASTSAMDTPALTPASVSSYASSGQSPLSNHSRSSFGGGMNGNAMYPSLPSVTGMSDLGSGYPTTTSAPASSLASGFDALDGRRYSGGRLQRQAPGQDSEMADADEAGDRTPKQSDSDSARPKSKGNSSIDPALRGEDVSGENASTPAAKSDGDEKRQEDWVENIRIIEAIRKYITDRLQGGDYDKEDGAAADDAKEGAEDDEAAKMAETAKMVEEKMAVVAAAVRSADDDGDVDVKYPTLPEA